ncbi:MAG: 3-methylcrotonyl-CoA carboxylase, partial [Boseongicola sp. SB0676_bin_33]|nr:3-methylcrotonyl-CoA carboxylase [Boseongicola sp. SB0676_bin_33]
AHLDVRVVTVDRKGAMHRFSMAAPDGGGATESANAILAPLVGQVVTVAVRPGEEVAKDAPLVVLEAMKMDHVLRAPRDGVVARVCVSEGQQAMQDSVLLEFEDPA